METKAVIDAVRNFLDDEHIRYDFIAEKKVIRTGFQLECKLKQANIQIDFQNSGLSIFAISPINADKNCFDEMIKYLSLLNFIVGIGSFNLNPETGMIFFKYGLFLKSLLNLLQYCFCLCFGFLATRHAGS